MGGGLPWQETQAKPVSMEVRTKVLGVLDQPLCLPRVLDLLSRELGKLCPGGLQQRVASWRGGRLSFSQTVMPQPPQ